MNSKKVFEDWNAMNKMGRQMMQNMMSQMCLMNMDEDDAETIESSCFEGFDNPMMFMQQACMMHMMFATTMFMMPFQMMKFMTEMMTGNMNVGDEENSKATTSGTFKIGSFDVPPEMLQKLMSMDMSPENLEKLQKVLDFVFGMIPDKYEEHDS